LQKVKRGELNAVLTRTGRRKGLRIEIPTPDGLFETAQSAKEQYDHGSNTPVISASRWASSLTVTLPSRFRRD